VMSCVQGDDISLRQAPLEKFQALTTPLSAPVSSLRCCASIAMAVIALSPCAFVNLHVLFSSSCATRSAQLVASATISTKVVRSDKAFGCQEVQFLTFLSVVVSCGLLDSYLNRSLPVHVSHTHTVPARSPLSASPSTTL
jgi:hypothetical protein